MTSRIVNHKVTEDEFAKAIGIILGDAEEVCEDDDESKGDTKENGAAKNEILATGDLWSHLHRAA
jgi:hypothetical protein